MEEVPSRRKQERLDAIKERMMLSLAHLRTDPQGMYTGVAADPFEEPVQDADDL